MSAHFLLFLLQATLVPWPPNNATPVDCFSVGFCSVEMCGDVPSRSSDVDAGARTDAVARTDADAEPALARTDADANHAVARADDADISVASTHADAELH